MLDPGLVTRLVARPGQEGDEAPVPDQAEEADQEVPHGEAVLATRHRHEDSQAHNRTQSAKHIAARPPPSWSLVNPVLPGRPTLWWCCIE